MFCVKILISLGLISSFMLVSCGKGDSPNTSDKDKNKEKHRGTTGEGGSTEQDRTPKHWILSVPFQKIKAGSFMMGSPESETDRDSFDETQVEVTISKPFEIMTKEVTQSQWVREVGSNPSKFKSEKRCPNNYDSEKNMCPDHPVESVSLKEVQEYIGKINKSLGLTGCDGTPDSSAGCYRLPTEAEWEYSARGGTDTAYSYGDDPSILGDYAWYKGNSDYKTHPVDLKKPNPYGLYDVHGNVWEWVQDRYRPDLTGGSDPLNTSGVHQVRRGGSWNYLAPALRSASRSGNVFFSGDSWVGFRLVRTL